MNGVYCTKCKHCNLEIIDNVLYVCIHEDECDSWDCEDSRPIEDRPFYEEKQTE